MAQRAMIGVRVVAYAKLVEEGCCSRSRARAIDNSKDERASSDRHPGDEMHEGDRLKRDIQLCKPDGGRCDHRHTAVILIGYVVAMVLAPGRTGRARSSNCRPAERSRRSETSSASSCHVSVRPRTSSPASSQHCLITSTLLASEWTLNVAHRSRRIC